MKLFPIVLILSFAAIANGQPVNTNQAAKFIPANEKSILIITKSDASWTMEELSTKALEFLLKQADAPPKGETLQTMVRFYPDDKTKMCEFAYNQGVGHAIWRVTFGYDGKIIKYVKRRTVG